MAKRTYRMEISVEVEDSERQRLIDTARGFYALSGSVSRIEDENTEVQLTPEEFIASVDDALMELVHQHPGFKQAGVEIGEMSCDTEEQFDPDDSIGSCVAETAQPELEEDEEEETYELDEFDTGAYLCRWPNGDASIVMASSRREAILSLDEWAGAHPSQLVPIDSFMADFALNNAGEIELTDFSETTRATFWETCFPELDALLGADGLRDASGELGPAGRERIQGAVEHERTRLWKNQPSDEPSTELGKEIATQMGTSAVVADHYVKRRAKEILKATPLRKGKPN